MCLHLAFVSFRIEKFESRATAQSAERQSYAIRDFIQRETHNPQVKEGSNDLAPSPSSTCGADRVSVFAANRRLGPGLGLQYGVHAARNPEAN
jgi:hypothetical protein